MASNKMNKIFQSKKGFTITEVLAGVALLSIVIVGGLTAFDQLGKMTDKNETQSTTDDRLQEIIENIRQNPTTQILQFDDPANLLKPDNLKMAWSNNVDAPATQCSECPGRYGYVITPATQATTDLYLVTVYFTHRDWNNEVKKFEFLVSK